MSGWKRILLGMSPREATIQRRGYRAPDPGVRARLERVVRTYVEGYNTALEVPHPVELARALEERYDPHHVGFAFEGAGTCHGLLDLLTPWRPCRVESFVRRAAGGHGHLVAVGAGLALGRMPLGSRRIGRYARRLDPEYSWCLADGVGFHHGLFRTEAYVAGCRQPPAAWPAPLRQLFDSGVGRSIWFVQGADPPGIGWAIERFPQPRRAELWCGIGLACAYAGGTAPETVAELGELAGPCRADFLSGIPFAALMRRKGENPSPWTGQVCRSALHMSAEEAADLIESKVRQALGPAPAKEDRSASYPVLRRLLAAACLPTERRRAAAG